MINFIYFINIEMDSIIDGLSNLRLSHLNINLEYNQLVSILDDYEEYHYTLSRYTRYLNSGFFQYYNYNDIILRIQHVFNMNDSHFIYNLDHDILSIFANFEV
jgi:hypothetical protein